MNRLISSSSLTLSIALVCAATGIGAVPVAQAAGPTPAPGTVNLLTTPPELTSKVAPNVVLTFDDSGSMGRNYMPDRRPYTGAAWGRPTSRTPRVRSPGTAAVRPTCAPA